MKIFLINILRWVMFLLIIFPITQGNLAWSIFLSTLAVIDYMIYVRGGDSLLFEDKTEIEKDLRKCQHIKLKKQLRIMEVEV